MLKHGMGQQLISGKAHVRKVASLCLEPSIYASSGLNTCLLPANLESCPCGLTGGGRVRRSHEGT
jgi:hypothetical protein